MSRRPTAEITSRRGSNNRRSSAGGPNPRTARRRRTSRRAEDATVDGLLRARLGQRLDLRIGNGRGRPLAVQAEGLANAAHHLGVAGVDDVVEVGGEHRLGERHRQGRIGAVEVVEDWTRQADAQVTAANRRKLWSTTAQV